MKIPANIIQTGKYTQGQEYMYADTYENYQGYYYVLNNKFFAGKIFNNLARELVKFDSTKVNKLKKDPKTAVYGKASGVNIKESKASGIVYKGDTIIRYFAKKLNVVPILIREINKKTFDELQSDPLYQTTSVIIAPGDFNLDSNEINKANQQMPGLKSFLIG